MNIGFQWDAAKSAANESKHGVSFLQAAQIFRGWVLKAADERRAYGKARFLALGIYDGIILKVAFTERDGDIRILSAWKAGRSDRKKYQGS